MTIVEKLCFALMYVNHLMSYYCDYTHFRTSFCKRDECIKQYYYDEDSIDQISYFCIRCNDTFFDRNILPYHFDDSRTTALKFTSIFFTLESVSYLIFIIGSKFDKIYFIKGFVIYILLSFQMFLIVGIKFNNLFLTPQVHGPFNFRNFYLVIRFSMIYISICRILNDERWVNKGYEITRDYLVKVTGYYLVKLGSKRIKGIFKKRV